MVRQLVKQGGEDGSGTGYMASLDSATVYTSRPVEMVSETGVLRSLREVLKDLLSVLCANAEPASSEGGNASSPDQGNTMVRLHGRILVVTSLNAVFYNIKMLLSNQAKGRSILQDEGAADAEGEVRGKHMEAVSSTKEKPEGANASRQGRDVYVNGRPAQALINGISPDLDAPLAWFYANLHSADFFLYIVVAVRE